MKICFFGTYDKKYSSNKIILDGFKKNFIKVLEINNDIRITPLNNSNHLAILNLIKRLWIKLSLIPLIFKNLSKIKKCDAIYVGYPGHIDILISYPLAKLLGKKLIFYPCIILYITFTEDVNLFTKDSIYAKLLKIYERFIYKLPDLIYSDIPLQKDVFINQFGVDPKKIKEIPIGADDLIYTYSGVKNSKNLNVVYYGLYSPLHGVEHIINAAKILKNQKNVKFLMVGDGQTFDQNYKLAKKNKLKNVIFYKDATEDNAKEILNSGHLFLGHAQKSPTVFRTLPNKVYQGLALGKVVITADTPASRGVFNHLGNAYLFKPANPKDLAKGILLLSKNPKLVSKIAENGYKLYISRFTPKMIAKKIIDDVSILVSKQKIKGAIKYAAS
ncbi:MAG: glycosyl transferase group 1 [uncultured bacterium]|nr:MAG: glycosyl transferase group 1 [uncultured bacterium]